MRPASPLEDMLERDWARQLFETQRGLATMTGWKLVYHVFRSRNSPAGFPDWVLIRERVIYAELKREKAKPSSAQVTWLDGLARAGAEVYVWKPGDLDEIGEILGRRWGFQGWTSERPPHLATFDRGAWTPRSAWVPGVGRAELLGSAA